MNEEIIELTRDMEVEDINISELFNDDLELLIDEESIDFICHLIEEGLEPRIFLV